MTSRKDEPLEFKLIPVDLPKLPDYAGRRHEVIMEWMAELGARDAKDMSFFLAEIGWNFYDILNKS